MVTATPPPIPTGERQPEAAGAGDAPVLAISGLSVAYGAVHAVRDVSLSVRAGETLGVVGESGSGKSTLAFATMGYLGANGRVAGGSIKLQGQELLTLSPAELRRFRGGPMAMVYQDPQTALNPSLVVGRQVAEAHQEHTGKSGRGCWARAVEMFGRVGLPDPERIARRYPHQLSGGQQQRVVIATALVNNPALLILDEPTTGLDVTTEALILDLVNELKQEFGAATLYITHNLGVIAQVCDRVAVMYTGEIVEEEDVVPLFRELCRYYGGSSGVVERLLRPIVGPRPPLRAVDGVSFDLMPGETLALIGESGSGKTTLARTIAGLIAPSGGQIRFLGQEATKPAGQRPAALRREMQMVFQNPDASLNPRHTAGQIIRRPVEMFLGLRGEAARQRVCELLTAVHLDPDFYDRYPGELSGGEKQRVSIARAFAVEPRLVICDEAVSALDVCVQAAILNLLIELQEQPGSSYLFISHDLSVVRHLAHRIGVMYLGKLVDFGPTEAIFEPPYHPSTEALISAVPEPDPQVRRKRIPLEGPVPSPAERPEGCPFAGRCPRYLGPICDDVPPPIHETESGEQIACHIPLDELSKPLAKPDGRSPPREVTRPPGGEGSFGLSIEEVAVSIR
ncbi:MAG: ABC transporter ATP-binding protein [Chloroflexi bacterium]|nr:ABC transporter ATP-binding protein [Chloroflexota bacterium]